MSQFSEMMGSFIRTGNYPLEANYIFNSEKELIEFYSDEFNKTLLHTGLLKIVSTEDYQTLYWVILRAGELILEPLISTGSIEDLLIEMQKVRNSLNLEIDNREQAIIEILGTADKTVFKEELDNLLAISDAVITLKEKVNALEKSLTNISDLLDSFFLSMDTIPEKDFKTLKGIRDFILSISLRLILESSNLLEELNLTQSGVGLDLSGKFSPDLETTYLKNSTSVMNALRTLDGLIKTALNRPSGIEEAYYDSDNLSVVLKFILSDGSIQETIIPMNSFVPEWDEWYEG